MCEYCENKKNLFLTRETFRKSCSNDSSTMIITKPEHGIVEIASQDNVSIYDKPTRTIRKIKINFCPMCERKLFELTLKQTVENSVKETINNDAYLWSCNCPDCGKKIHRGSEERTFYCEQCGTHLYQRAFTEEELNKARFEREMDEYED